jgi:hypothetical protein
LALAPIQSILKKLLYISAKYNAFASISKWFSPKRNSNCLFSFISSLKYKKIEYYKDVPMWLLCIGFLELRSKTLLDWLRKNWRDRRRANSS